MIALCVVAVLLGKLQSSANAGGRFDILTRLIQTVVGSPGAGVDGMLQNGSESFSGLFRGRELQQKIRLYEQMSHEYAMYTERVQLLESQIDELRKLANLPEYTFKLSDGTERSAAKIPGQIIQYFPAENRVTLNIGSAQQVRPGAPVITGEGIVGVVQTVDKNKSQVRLICSPEPFQIGATVLGQPPVTELITGEAIDRLIIKFTDINATVKVGDLVVTSGLSEKIPGGIEIGRVVQITNFEDQGMRIAQVFPSVRLAEVREVFVLR